MVQEFLDSIVNFFVMLFNEITQFFLDILIFFIEAFLNLFALIIEQIPVPDFAQGGMQSLFSGIDSSILYLLVMSGFFQGMAIYGLGVSFRLLRKIVTLFQW